MEINEETYALLVAGALAKSCLVLELELVEIVIRASKAGHCWSQVLIIILSQILVALDMDYW